METISKTERAVGSRSTGNGRYAGVSTRWPGRFPAGGLASMLPQLDGIGRRTVIQVHRPADGSLLGEVPLMDHVQVLEAVERARSVQRGWVSLQSADRFAQLRTLADVLEASSDRLVETIRDETGKPEVEAMAEILATVELLQYYDQVAPRVLRREWLGTGWLVGKSAFTYREPYGVIGAITPWNYPFFIVADVVAAALYTGNAVVAKPSEHTPFSALLLQSLCVDAGLPEGLVQVVTGDGSTGAALVEAGVDKVAFTGSSQTGRKVMVAAAQSLTPVSLELGGKDVAIVLEDADLDRAARGVVYGAFYNAGQTCVSIERVFVVEQVYDDFVARVTELAGELRVGTEGEYDVGPVITTEQLEVVERQLEDALARGARVTVGGERVSPESRLFRPTVLVDVDQSMRVLWEETFGPLLPVMPVRDEEEAVRLANVSPFGLFASVWTEDRDRGETVAEQLHAGGVSVNDTLSHYSVPGLPFGGVGESGFGRRRGIAGLEEMSRTRSVLVHRTGLSRELWWFPYSERATRLMRALLVYRQSSGLGRVLHGLRRFFLRMGR
jgi:succinate-semialdehyde dehydrogenase/glutarate-semialdehyde dehydrogenase